MNSNVVYVCYHKALLCSSYHINLIVSFSCLPFSLPHLDVCGNATRSAHLHPKVSVIFVICGLMLLVKAFLMNTLNLSSHYLH